MLEKTFVLTVREVPKSVNAGGGGVRTNHYAAARIKKEWEGKYTMELLAAKVPKPMQFCHVAVTIYWKHRNRRDSTNWFEPAYKPLLDALKKGGWLQDDSDEYVKVSPVEFAYPDQWPFADPRVKGYMDIRLDCSYL